jgi:hypothetical protein
MTFDVDAAEISLVDTLWGFNSLFRKSHKALGRFCKRFNKYISVLVTLMTENVAVGCVCFFRGFRSEYALGCSLAQKQRLK